MSRREVRGRARAGQPRFEAHPRGGRAGERYKYEDGFGPLDELNDATNVHLLYDNYQYYQLPVAGNDFRVNQYYQLPVASNDFRGNRRPHGQQGYGRGNTSGNIQPENFHEHRGRRGRNHSEKRTESGNTRDKTEGQTNEETSKDNEACGMGRLMNLLNGDRDENEILFKLQTPYFGFMQRLQQGSINEKMTELLIKVISKTCKSVHQNQLIDLLSKIQNSNFLKSDLQLYLSRFLSEDKMIETNICNAIINILRTFSKLFPSKSLAVVTLLSAPLEQVLTIDTPDYNDANKEFKKLQEETEEIRKQLQSGIVQRDQERQVEWTVDESEDYRRMSVVPTSEDIRGQGDPYLRENKIYRKYKDAHDYLDVQFRLMKEDLVRPLREGLAELLRNREAGIGRRTKNNIRVYSHVKITSIRCSDYGLVYKIQFDVSRLGKVRWEAGKRLMFGSLVCLSADEFKNMLIATVAERDARDLSRGVTYLYIDKDANQNKYIRLDQTYEMIESPAYYEPYKCVLEALQKFTDEDKLPFENYLINNIGEGKVPPPKYLKEDMTYDISSLLRTKEEDKKIKCVAWRNLMRFDDDDFSKRSTDFVTVLDLKSWPTAERLGLDESQYNALQRALTKEFAVIQGPPGTGKTFIGARLVQVLLENNENRERRWEGPIMLVCFTNHALDQFLEEIVRLYPNDVDKGLFVRIGSTSKSENEELKKCFLKHIQQNRRKNYQEFRGATIEPKEKMKELEKAIMKLSAYAEIAAKELIHPDALRPYMRHVQFKHVGQFLKWLCDRRAAPGTPNLLGVDVTLDNNETQPVAEEAFEDVEILETEEREQNENNLKSAEVKFQAVAKTVLEENKFLKLTGQEENIVKDFYQTAHGVRRRFQDAFPESHEIVNVKKHWQLTLADRWRLYNYWAKSFIAAQREEMQALLKDHAMEKRKLEEVREELDYKIFRYAKIIAMTTTGAAKRSDLLRRLAPKIVIVEEAAEVLEAHIVASLSEDCEHLILIGDHQQLKPKPADYSLSKKYRLDVSLFEKVVLNKLHCDRLTIQHRMRPEIAELLVPHIYKSLDNHESVLRYENVANVFGNLFFLSHSENENSTDDNRSQSNDHEAAFLAELCRYFLYVGYEPKQITVLTTYTGQMFLLRKFMPRAEFEGVRITPVDNFQGEENDIILLSLVRSNQDNRIGFLKIPNRVCVALSRAKRGLYIIGNGDLLRDVSPLWRDILDTLKKQNRMVDSLPLGCRKHPEKVSFVKTATDFQTVPRSGCEYHCDYRLSCGHVCAKLCHELDPEHKLYKCQKPCSKLCANDMHPCRDLCFETCSDCKELVDRILSRCGHQATMCCYLEEEKFKCKEACKLECLAGHLCQQRCYEECICKVQVTRTLTRCGHVATMPCYMSEDMHQCKEPCENLCLSGHPCNRLCFEKCRPCQVLVTKILSVCQHEATMPCHLPEFRYYCKEPCKKFCPFTHPCNQLCSELCRPCEVLVTRTLSACKHEATMPCHLPEQSFKCKEPCTKSCPREHPCQKLCYENCDLCRVPVTKILSLCNHEAIMPCYMEEVQYMLKNRCTVEVELTLPLCGHVVKRPCCDGKLPYKCLESCRKSCSSGHPCERKCHKPCGVCKVRVEKVLPRCEHKAVMPCYQPVDSYTCQIKCNRTCPDGHSCPEFCHEKCDDCKVLVEKILPGCEHKAKMPCYREPSEHRCHLPCERNCPEGHRCPKKCSDDCGNCMLKVTKILPQCNHVNTVKCYQSPNNVRCNLPCEKTLECGHDCQENCGAGKCTILCMAKVEKELLCKHMAKMYCHLDPSLFVCHHRMEKTLPCDHVTTVECHQDPKTVVCRQQVEKKLPCEHVATMECSMNPATYRCLQRVKVEICEYGHTKEVDCWDKGTTFSVCDEMVNLACSTGLPNHTISVQCQAQETTDLTGCSNVCSAGLECGHSCTRTCRVCVVAKKHSTCKQSCNKPFSLCPHKCLHRCADPCRPCDKSSSHGCFHRNGKLCRCSESYEICLKSCEWNCPHYACTTICSQPCNRPPCNQPCRKPLRCGHVCSGLCGEPCISTCRRCKREQFSKMSRPNFSDLPNEARFLELRPCCHLVEVSAMDVWVQENVQQLPGILDNACFLFCPVCLGKVDFCPRYNQYIRRHELSLNAARKLIKASGQLKSMIEGYNDLWLRANQRNTEVKENLSQMGINKRIKLGTLCILHEIEVMESLKKNPIRPGSQKCQNILWNIRQRISEEDFNYEDKPGLAADIILIYRAFMDAQVRRLTSFLRGQNLRVLDMCRKLLNELECIEVREENFLNIWTIIEKLNKNVSMKVSPQDRRDQITDYIDHLNSFYDLQLDATFMSRWVCCRLGHVYSTNEIIDKDEKINKDQINALCPQCHPLHNVLLYFLKPVFDETAAVTEIDTSAYYKHKIFAENVTDGNVDILGGAIGGSKLPDSNVKESAAQKRVHVTPEKQIVDETSFRGGFPWRRGRRGNASWAQTRQNSEYLPDKQQQLVNATSEPWTRSHSRSSADVESPKHTNRGRRGWRSDWSMNDRCWTDGSNEIGKVTASTFAKSSDMRNGSSTANTHRTKFRGGFDVSNDVRVQPNWRVPTDRGGTQRSTSRDANRDNPLSWLNTVRSQLENIDRANTSVEFNKTQDLVPVGNDKPGSKRGAKYTRGRRSFRR